MTDLVFLAELDVEGGLVDIAARQPGIVTQVMVQEGDEVRSGQILAQLDDQDAHAPGRAVGDPRAAVVPAQDAGGVPALERHAAGAVLGHPHAVAEAAALEGEGDLLLGAGPM